MLDIERGQLAEIRPFFWRTDAAISKKQLGLHSAPGLQDRFTSKKNLFYAVAPAWPENGRMVVKALTKRKAAVKGRAFGSPLARGLKPRASTAAFSTPGKPGASAAVKDLALLGYHGPEARRSCFHLEDRGRLKY